MIWLLNRTFFRPINRVIAAREKNKGGRFGEAEEILQSVETKNSAYNSAMLEARSKSYALIEREKTEAMAKRQSEIDAVKTETEQAVAAETAELNRQAAEAKTTIAREAEQMAERISASILRW